MTLKKLNELGTEPKIRQRNVKLSESKRVTVEVIHAILLDKGVLLQARSPTAAGTTGLKKRDRQAKVTIVETI